MKPITYMAAALAGLSLTNSASAQMWGSAGGVTVALTYSYTAPALAAKYDDGKVIPASDGGGPEYRNSFSVETIKKVKMDDGDGGFYYEDMVVKTVSTEEYGSKIVTGKWGNADIIKALVASGVLPQKGTKAPYTAGWALIVAYSPDGEPQFFARHTDKTAVSLSEVLGVGIPPSSEEGEGEARARSEKTVTTETTPIDAEGYITESYSLTESYKTPSGAIVPFEPMEPGDLPTPLEVYGLLTGSGKAVFKTYGTGDEKVTDLLYVPGAIKLDKITATSELGDVVEGSISIGAASVVDFATYFEDQES